MKTVLLALGALGLTAATAYAAFCIKTGISRAHDDFSHNPGSFSGLVGSNVADGRRRCVEREIGRHVGIRRHVRLLPSPDQSL